MSVANPAYNILRKSVVGEEGEWCKMFDPPTASPATRERLNPTNPVPAFVAATIPGATMTIPNTLQLDLLNNLSITMWDGKKVNFFAFQDLNTGQTAWPAPTIRVPRGVIFHCFTQGKGPPPHTIHWHGIEPTPMNDGVGHCSMELGAYTYQWQPNYIGSYFFHCHRNTMQHFEFGLYGFLIIEPPDAYAQQNPALPNYAGGYPRRTAANLTNFPQFPGFVGGDLAGADPQAMTVPYDTEALWVIDDRDSIWSDKMKNARATFPTHGNQPGINDLFLKGDFHDFNADYFFVTGVPFPAPVGGTVACASNVVVPAIANSGVTGMQVSVNAQRNQTILVRCLCAAYVSIKVTFPVDVVIIAFDGRALGVPPFGDYSSPFLLKAGTPFALSTARRFDALIRSADTVNSFANVEFINNRGGRTLLNGRIPIVIN
jgi:hypothetical protein